jgi:prophage tail gpP-like protein
MLRLQGVIGRTNRWEAVIAGIPGRDGSVVVRAGDTLEGLRIRRIDRDTVVVGAVDTTWKLTVKGVWP